MPNPECWDDDAAVTFAQRMLGLVRANISQPDRPLIGIFLIDERCVPSPLWDGHPAPTEPTWAPVDVYERGPDGAVREATDFSPTDLTRAMRHFAELSVAPYAVVVGAASSFCLARVARRVGLDVASMVSSRAVLTVVGGGSPVGSDAFADCLFAFVASRDGFRYYVEWFWGDDHDDLFTRSGEDVTLESQQFNVFDGQRST